MCSSDLAHKHAHRSGNTITNCVRRRSILGSGGSSHLQGWRCSGLITDCVLCHLCSIYSGKCDPPLLFSPFCSITARKEECCSLLSSPSLPSSLLPYLLLSSPSLPSSLLPYPILSFPPLCSSYLPPQSSSRGCMCAGVCVSGMHASLESGSQMAER